MDLYNLPAEELDDALALFVHHCFDTGIAYSTAVHAVLYAQVRRPRLRKLLPTAWVRIGAWKLQRPIRLRVPLPLPLLQAMFITALQHGFVTDVARAHLWLPFAVCLRLGFFALLRPVEIAQLSREFLALPADAILGFGQRIVCTICDPKNRAAAGRLQFSIASDPCCIAWVSWLCARLPSTWRIYTGTQIQFANMFRELVGILGLDGCGFTPASLRAGGATHMFMDGTPIDRLKFLGRWRALQSLEHYIQEAISCLVLCRLEQREADKIAAINEAFADGLAPPLQPWWGFFDRSSQHHRRRARSHRARLVTERA
jgi:hypothetical protein